VAGASRGWRRSAGGGAVAEAGGPVAEKLRPQDGKRREDAADLGYGDGAEIAAVEGAWVGGEEPDLARVDAVGAGGRMGERPAVAVGRLGGCRGEGAAVDGEGAGGEIDTVAGGGEDELAEGAGAAAAGPGIEVAAAARQDGGGQGRAGEHEVTGAGRAAERLEKVEAAGKAGAEVDAQGGHRRWPGREEIGRRGGKEKSGKGRGEEGGAAGWSEDWHSRAGPRQAGGSRESEAPAWAPGSTLFGQRL
jgi:hypothetical protein